MRSEIRTSYSEIHYSLHELERIDALDGIGLARVPDDADLDLILSTLVAVLDFPIGFIALVDDDALRFISRVGLDLTEVPRAASFCTHTIRNDGPLVVEDARLDSRYRSLPLVAGAPYLVAYAGVPIRPSAGYRIATLCVADMQPRHVGEAQKATLCRFAGLVERLIAGIEQSARSTADQHGLRRYRDCGTACLRPRQRIDAWSGLSAGASHVRCGCDGAGQGRQDRYRQPDDVAAGLATGLMAYPPNECIVAVFMHLSVKRARVHGEKMCLICSM
jgi:GAF domain